MTSILLLSGAGFWGPGRGGSTGYRIHQFIDSFRWWLFTAPVQWMLGVMFTRKDELEKQAGCRVKRSHYPQCPLSSCHSF